MNGLGPNRSAVSVYSPGSGIHSKSAVSPTPTTPPATTPPRKPDSSREATRAVATARAFLANPTVLLLDEPTSSVEPDSEAAIIAALDRLMAGRTTVLTSHRPSLINQADVVYVIEDGRVTEQGRPAELVRRDGWFARFIRAATEAALANETVQ